MDGNGNVTNTIVADEAFVESFYPGLYREAGTVATPPDTETPSPTTEPTPATTTMPTLVIEHIEADTENADKTAIRVDADGVTDVTCPVGTVLTVTGVLRDAGGAIVPLSDDFRMPFRSRDGREKILRADVVAGSATINVPLRESGAWSVTATTINESLPAALQMVFAGIRIFVVET